MFSEQVNWLIAKQLSQGNKGLRKCKFSDPQPRPWPFSEQVGRDKANRPGHPVVGSRWAGL